MAEFRKKVNNSEGFSPKKANDTLPSYAGTTDTVLNSFKEDGEFANGYEYAKSIGKPFSYGVAKDGQIAYSQTSPVSIDG